MSTSVVRLAPVSQAILETLRQLRTHPAPVFVVASLLGLGGFYQFYWPRFLVFIATALILFTLYMIQKAQWEVVVPIQIFFLGTWAYNIFDSAPHPLPGIMLTFLILICAGFWVLLGRPGFSQLTLLHWVYLTIATLIVWELSTLIKLFWPVEPWSRTFLVVCAFVFLHFAVRLRLSGSQQGKILLAPLAIILSLVAIVISSTTIPIA